MVHYVYEILNEDGVICRLFSVTCNNAIEADNLASKECKNGETYNCIEWEDADW